MLPRDQVRRELPSLYGFNQIEVTGSLGRRSLGAERKSR